MVTKVVAKGTYGLITWVWHQFLILLLFAFIFYGGLITGGYMEGRRHIDSGTEIRKMQGQMKELVGEVEAMKKRVWR